MTSDILECVAQHTLVNDLRAGEVVDDDAAARIIWSSVVEPGDRVAGSMIGDFGAARALRRVLESDRASGATRPLPPASGLGPGVQSVSDAEMTEAFARWRARLESGNVVAQIEAAVRLGVQVVLPGDDVWPVGLSDAGDHAPHALWLRGNRSTLAGTRRSVAVVGARASTGYGEHVTMDLVSGLVARGFVIVSGAAYGIDGMAHRAALADDGDTIAVLAGGIDRLYPSGHDALLQRIIANGAVVTEMPPGYSPTKWRFLQRNRLIAAMSSATVVVEAGWRSGSLNTAHHATAIGRPVGVVPGPVTSASSAGCHRLLREEPTMCVTTSQEIIELIDGPEPTAVAREVGADQLSDVETRALDALSSSPRSLAELAHKSGLAPQQLESALGVLSALGFAGENDTGWRRVNQKASAIR